MVYSWKSLETAKDQYDFSRIERDLAFLDGAATANCSSRSRTVSSKCSTATCRPICCRSPSTAADWSPQVDNPGENQPEGHGWVDAAVEPGGARALSEAAGGAGAEIRRARVRNQPARESAIDVDIKHDQTGFTCDEIFRGGRSRTSRTRARCSAKSHVVQYVNFWPCEWDNDREVHVAHLRVRASQPDRPRRPGHRAVQEGADEELLSVLQSVQGAT